MGKISKSSEIKLSVVPIHHHEDMLDQCVQLINSEWPRSYSARMWSLKASKDTLPTSLVLVDGELSSSEQTGGDCSSTATVLAHAKLSVIPSDSKAVLVESVVVDARYRGQGLGRILMTAAEDHCFKVLQLNTIFLSTVDQEGFYAKLGYELCKAINIFGTRSATNNCTKKIWMKKTFVDWERTNGGRNG